MATMYALPVIFLIYGYICYSMAKKKNASVQMWGQMRMALT